MTAYLLEHAFVDGRVQDDVLVEIEGGRVVDVVLPDENSHFLALAEGRKYRNARFSGDSAARLPGRPRPRGAPPPPPPATGRV